MKVSTIVWSAYTAATIVCSFVLALTACAFVMSLPGESGARDYIHARVSETPALAFVALPLSVLFLIAPFYAAKWTYRGVLNAGLSLSKKIKIKNGY
jgi:hypothetical protein